MGFKRPAEYTEEEVEAVRCLQRAYSTKRAREYVKKLVRQNYVKVYDRLNDEYVYKNRNTGEISINKPVFLGDEDLPTPKNYAAPIDYDAGDNGGEEGFVLVVTCTQFAHEKLPEIAIGAKGDHTKVHEILSHELICKINSENVIELEDPTMAQFIDTLDRLRRQCTSGGFLVMYLCTHIATVWGGEKQRGSNSSGMAHILFHDTVWRDSKKVAESSLSLNQFIDALNKIFCKRKVLIMSHAHEAYKAPSVLGSKLLYPPPNYMVDLANEAHCAVLGCCSVGAPLRTSIDHSPPLWEQLRTKHRPLKPTKHLYDDDSVKTEGEESKQISEDEGVDEIVAAQVAAKKRRKKGFLSKLFYKKPTLDSLGDFPNDDEFEEWQEEQRIAAILASGIDPEGHLHTRNELCVKIRRDMKMPELRDLAPDPPPANLEPTWKPAELKEGQDPKDIEGHYDCAMPTPDDFAAHESALWWYRAQQAVFRPANFVHGQFRNNFMQHGPTARQMSFQGVETTNSSLFGRALVKALHGGASTPGKLLVTVRDIYDTVLKLMFEEAKEAEKQIVENAALTYKQLAHDVKHGKVKMSESKLKKASIPPVFTQTPVLVVPKGESGVDAQEFPVCFCCGPPAAPERPFIVRVRTNDVTVQWVNPIFEGVQPTVYHILMRSTSRNFSGWNEVPNKVEIKTMSFTVKNLPAGLPVNFKVRSYNPGGWSTWSDISQRCVPGIELTPPTTEARWLRITEGGVLAVIDILRYHKQNRMEYLLGLSRLVDHGQKMQGFKKEFQIMVAELCTHALHTFVGDIEIIALALIVSGYALISKNPKVVRVHLIKEGVIEIIEELLKNKRNTPRIIGAIAWLRSKLPKNVPPNPVIIYEEKEQKESEEYLAAQEEVKEMDASIIRALAKVTMDM